MEHFRAKAKQVERPAAMKRASSTGSSSSSLHRPSIFRHASGSKEGARIERQHADGQRPVSRGSSMLHGAVELPSASYAQRPSSSASRRISSLSAQSDGSSVFSSDAHSRPLERADSVYNMDVEALLASHNTFLHPAHLERLYDRHNALLSARRESVLREDEEEYHRPSTASSSRSRPSLDLPLATSQPLRQTASLHRQQLSLPIAESASESSKNSGRSEPVTLARPSTAPQRSTSPTMEELSMRIPRLPGGSVHLARPSGQNLALTSGPLGRALSKQGFSDDSILEHKAPSLSRAASVSSAQSAHNIPARFTYARRDSTDSAAEAVNIPVYSPRSSTSSKPASFRWSMSSRETTSTACSSRTSSQQTPKAILEQLEPAAPAGDGGDTQQSSHRRRPSGFGHRKDQASIDSLDSLSLELIAASDFPIPPPSRKGSTASVLSAAPSSQGSFSGQCRLQAPREESHVGERDSASGFPSAPMSREASSGSTSRSQCTGVVNRAILNASLASRSRRPSAQV